MWKGRFKVQGSRFKVGVENRCRCRKVGSTYRTGRASRPEKRMEGGFRLRSRPARSNRQNVVATSAKGDNRRLLSHSPRSDVAGCYQAFLRRPAKRFFLLPAGRLSPPQASFSFNIFEIIAVSQKYGLGAATENSNFEARTNHGRPSPAEEWWLIAPGAD